jgi:hypothetical protein
VGEAIWEAHGRVRKSRKSPHTCKTLPFILYGVPHLLKAIWFLAGGIGSENSHQFDCSSVLR